MNATSPVLCPIDFSDASKASLRQAAAVAKHFGAPLIVLTVDDPLLAEVARQGGPELRNETERELHRFCGDALNAGGLPGDRLRYLITEGKPASEILRVARAEEPGLIVMSSQGRSGARKMFFGSTAERVLRETTVPVLVTRDGRAPISTLADAGRHVHRILVPVDLSESSADQVRVASAVAAALAVPILLLHVLEPVFVPYNVRLAIGGVDAVRRERAAEAMGDLAAAVTGGPAETIVITGDPSEEITKMAETRGARLIVIGLHSAGALGPRMGSVTYRVLSMTQSIVLALPPRVP